MKNRGPSILKRTIVLNNKSTVISRIYYVHYTNTQTLFLTPSLTLNRNAPGLIHIVHFTNYKRGTRHANHGNTPSPHHTDTDSCLFSEHTLNGLTLVVKLKCCL